MAEQNLRGLTPVGNTDNNDYKLEDFEGKDFTVRTIRAIDVNLCGYHLEFRNNIVKTPTGSQKIGAKYELKAKDFPAKRILKNGNVVIDQSKSVLPEIMLKLTQPMNRVVEILMAVEAEKDEPVKRTGRPAKKDKNDTEE